MSSLWCCTYRGTLHFFFSGLTQISKTNLYLLLVPLQYLVGSESSLVLKTIGLLVG